MLPICLKKILALRQFRGKVSWKYIISLHSRYHDLTCYVSLVKCERRFKIFLSRLHKIIKSRRRFPNLSVKIAQQINIFRWRCEGTFPGLHSHKHIVYQWDITRWEEWRRLSPIHRSWLFICVLEPNKNRFGNRGKKKTEMFFKKNSVRKKKNSIF